jgi:hypothetical protein
VWRKHNEVFYSPAFRLFLKGADGKEPVQELRITALGEAIDVAATMALHAQREGICSIDQVTTSYQDMPHGRGCAQLCMKVVAIGSPSMCRRRLLPVTESAVRKHGAEGLDFCLVGCRGGLPDASWSLLCKTRW